MKKHDPKTGKFVRTTPDYKAMYEAEVKKNSGLQENAKLAQDGIECIMRERDEYRRKYNDALGMLHDKDYRIEFLLDHCSFLVRWMYKRQFKK